MRGLMCHLRSLAVFISIVAIVSCRGVRAAELSSTSPAKDVKPQAEQPTDEHPVVATLVTEHSSLPLIAGGKTRVGVWFAIAPGWHIYAKEPGDAGLPTQIAWTVPAGATMSELHWPKASRFIDSGDIITYGYAGTVLLNSTLTATNPKQMGTNPVPIHAKVRWLACQRLCLPGSAELDLAIPFSSAPQARSADAKKFD